MSVLGTGAAAGVAQTALQAQQIAQQRDKRTTQSAADATRLQNLLESHLRALEEGDETETPAQVRIDGQLPEQESGQPSPGQSETEEEDESAVSQTHDTESSSPSATKHSTSHIDGDQLYQHLDIEA